MKIIELHESVTASNDRDADALRKRMKEQGTLMINLMSSPGSGKTTLLTATIKALKDEGILVRSSRDYSTWNADKMNLAGMTVSYPQHSVLSMPEFEGLRFIRKSNNDKPTLLADNPLVQKFLDAEKVVEELDSSAKSIKANVKAVVYSVNSTKRLVEVWPEAAELIPSDIEVVRAAVPAIDFNNLNASIGIPSNKKA